MSNQEESEKTKEDAWMRELMEWLDSSPEHQAQQETEFSEMVFHFDKTIK